jgi:hypothetical protein
MKFPLVTYLLPRATPVAVIGLSLVVSGFVGLPKGWAQTEVEVSRDGVAQLPIVLPPDADPELVQLAADLAAALKKITGGEFAVEAGQGKGAAGIILGLAGDWPDCLPAPPKGRSPVLLRDDYRIKTEAGRILLIGRTPHGVRNAVWDLLHRVGFRHFFPGDHWEVWPQKPSLSTGVDAYESPSFYTRRLFLGGSTWRESIVRFRRWEERNRMVSGFRLNTGHSYGGIIKRNQAFFEANPEAIAHHGDRIPEKFDPSQPGLLDVIREDSVAQFDKNPELDCISMDPSDGGGWRMDCPLGSPSNQAVMIANAAAEAIQARYPGRKVGIYAYNQHSPPPEIEVNGNVIVSVATGFLREGFTTEALLKLWNDKGAETGIREYLSVWTWDNDMPGKSRAAQLDYVKTSILKFHELGARYWTTEGSNGWGAHGLGYYLASRYLWDVKEVARHDEIVDDFLRLSFGAAEPEMRKFYRLTLAEGRPLVSNDLIGRLYRTLDEALAKADSPEVTNRVLDFAVYTRFVELMFAFQSRTGSARQAAYDEMAKFVYRTRHSDMVNSLAVFKSLALRDKEIKTTNHLVKEHSHPLKVTEPVTPDDLRSLIKAGIEANKLNDFEPVAFSGDLVPMQGGEGVDPRQRPYMLRGTNPIFVYFAAGTAEVEFTVKSGLIYGDRGPVLMKLYSELHPIQGEPVAEQSVPPDKTEHTIRLKSSYPGLHRLEVTDGLAGTEIEWPADQRVAFPVSPDLKARFGGGAADFFFYVPEGTATVGGYSGASAGSIESPDGTRVFNFREMKEPGFFSIPVNGGDHGWWKMVQVKGEKLLLTVPPYLMRATAEALVPIEVVPKDQ